MTEGIQAEFWREFYEKAWKFRMAFIDELIQEGETCPYRIVQRFANHERGFETKINNGEIRWEKKEFDPSHGELLPTGFPVFERTIIRGNYVSRPQYMNENYARLLIDVIDKGSYDCIVELGSGYGKTLIELYYNGAPKTLKYIGAELTDSGCETMRKLFALMPDGIMEARKFDFLDPDFSFLRPYKRVFFFTVYAIQQVQQIPMRLIEAMSAAAETVKTVHIEPFGFQLEPGLGAETIIHAEFIRNKGWNLNLGPTLVQAQRDGTIRGMYLAAEILGGGHDPTSLAVWEGGTRKS